MEDVNRQQQSAAEETVQKNFLEEIIENDLASGRVESVMTRFPPEPNGYLHIGHAKSICLNFGLAQKYGGRTNLRFDDTNPVKEDTEYVDSIKEDIRWLGFNWAGEYYASDYFQQLYDWAVVLIKKGLAYVDDQTQEEIRANRGTVQQPGVDSPWRNRSVEENLDLFERMKNGEFPDGSKVLRAKIDMAHPNMMFRDPLMYRIIHASHHRTGDKWCIYPMYDYAHGQCDSIEHITHSICTLEFDVHRPLYDWFIEQLGIFPSHQYEFARLNLTYTVMSKRKLLELVRNGFVSGWDDPRMPTICGIRRRGYTPESIRNFAEKVGVAKRDNLIDLSLLEWCLREDLNKRSNRYMVVTDPVKLVITNWNDGECSAATEVETGRTEYCTAPKNPEDPEAGQRTILFGRRLHGRASQEVLPSASGRRGAPEILLHRQVRGGGQGRRGQYHRDPLHLRSDYQTRQRYLALRQGHHPLGQRHPVREGPSETLRPALHRGRHERHSRGQGLQGISEPRLPQGGGRSRRARPAGGQLGHRRAVRAQRLLHQGQGLYTGAAGIQPCYRTQEQFLSQ